jgi:hypothetical protein
LAGAPMTEVARKLGRTVAAVQHEAMRSGVKKKCQEEIKGSW